jgi:glutathione S-transferase
MARIAAIGHGRPQELFSKQALAIAAQAAPDPVGPSIADDALPAPGAEVAIRPEGYVTEAVTGTLVQVDRFDVAIRRADPALGEVIVHFPRVGYTIKARKDTPWD